MVYVSVDMVRVLDEKLDEGVVKLVKETKLGLDELKDALVVARACKYLGRSGLTGEGEALLEAVKLLTQQTEAEKPA